VHFHVYENTRACSHSRQVVIYTMQYLPRSGGIAFILFTQEGKAWTKAHSIHFPEWRKKWKLAQVPLAPCLRGSHVIPSHFSLSTASQLDSLPCLQRFSSDPHTLPASSLDYIEQTYPCHSPASSLQWLPVA
jgi:hypothetical protein